MAKRRTKAALAELVALWKSGGAHLVKCPDGSVVPRRQREGELVRELRILYSDPEAPPDAPTTDPEADPA